MISLLARRSMGELPLALRSWRENVNDIQDPKIIPVLILTM